MTMQAQAPSFERDIRPLFRPKDIESMSDAFDLSSYEDVRQRGVMLALLLFGRASDQLGRRRVLLPGLACAALSAVASLVAKGLALLLVGRVLSGLSAGIFVGTATAALVDLVGPGRSQGATLMATAANITGLGLGALLAGVLAQGRTRPLLPRRASGN
jgi:MFS family permease